MFLSNITAHMLLLCFYFSFAFHSTFHISTSIGGGIGGKIHIVMVDIPHLHVVVMAA